MIIKDLIQAEEFVTAWQLMSHTRVPAELRFTVPAKVARHVYSNHLSDAKVVDVRGRNCILVQWYPGQLEWLPRNRVRFAADDPIVVGDPREAPRPHPPGIPVKATTSLRRGQKAFKLRSHNWQLVTIQSVSPLEVTVTIDGSASGEEKCEKTDLALLEDQ